MRQDDQGCCPLQTTASWVCDKVSAQARVWIAVGLVCLVALPVCLPLFSSQLLMGHDSMGAYIRLLGLREYAGSGQFFVRWFPDLNWGYGGPVFNFYPPLFYILTSVVDLLFRQPALSINVVLIFLWVSSGLSMFFLVRHYWGGCAGLVSAAAYLYAPYHIVDVYTRGAYAEFMAFALLPLILLSFSRLAGTMRPWWLVSAAVSVAALFLTHNATCLMFMPFLICYVFFVSIRARQGMGKALGIAGSALVIGTALAAFFWLPALVEKSAITEDFLIHGRYDFWKNFIDWKAVLSLPWPLSGNPGAGFDGISFDVGGWYVLCAALTVVVSAFHRDREKENWRTGFFLMMAAVAVYLVTPASRWIWDRLPLLAFLQFPWRFLVLTSLGLSVLFGGWIRFIPGNTLRLGSAIVVALILAGSGARSLTGPSFVPAPLQQPSVQIASKIFLGEGEYTPRWIKFPPKAPAVGLIAARSGEVKVGEVYSRSRVEHAFTVNALEPSYLAANIFYFPGWQVLIDGQRAGIDTRDPDGRITFLVPGGEHQVTIRLGLTEVQFWAAALSWSAAGLLFLAAFCLFRSHKPGSSPETNHTR